MVQIEPGIVESLNGDRRGGAMLNRLVADRNIWAGAPTVDFSQPATQPQRSIRVSGLNKEQAEDLLDWLEANGYRGYTIAYAAGRGFTVSCSNNREATG